MYERSAEPEFAVVADAWFDGERRHDTAVTARVVDGRIADLDHGDLAEPLARRGLPVHRAAFLMPGLVDAHVHLFLDGAPTDAGVRASHLKQPLDALVDAARASARQSIACGVTLVRDAGDRHGINDTIRAEAAQAASGLPRVRSGGVALRRPKRYGAFMATEVGDAAEIRQTVTKLAAGNDEIKLILTGIIDFDAGAVTDEPQFALEEARLVVETARACGRQTFAHCSGAKGLEIAVEARVDSIEHGFFMQRGFLERMADRGIAWTPTFCPVHFQWARPEAVGWSAGTVQNLRRILDDHARHLRLAQELGVRLLLGTDAGSMGVEHGHAVCEEIDRFLDAGLSLEHVLAAATANPRRYFGFEHATLARGAPFDALLLDASPFEDLGALRRPSRVAIGPRGGGLLQPPGSSAVADR